MGWVGAAAMMMVGLMAWGRPLPWDDLSAGASAATSGGRAAAICIVAGAQLLFMTLVADDLFPETPMYVTGWLKAFCAAAAGTAVVWLVAMSSL